VQLIWVELMDMIEHSPPKPSPMKTCVDPVAVAKLAPFTVRAYPPPMVPLEGETELTTIS